MKKEFGIGGIIMLGIVMIVGVILLQAAAQNVGEVTNTVAVVNYTFDTPVNETAGYITEYKSISGVTVLNKTNGVAIGSGNYTLTNNVPYNGGVAIRIVPDADAGYRSPYDWHVSGTAEPLTYGDSGGRALSNLIIILMGLALVAVAVGYGVKEYM